jgi:hypothetical protein
MPPTRGATPDSYPERTRARELDALETRAVEHFGVHGRDTDETVTVIKKLRGEVPEVRIAAAVDAAIAQKAHSLIWLEKRARDPNARPSGAVVVDRSGDAHVDRAVCDHCGGKSGWMETDDGIGRCPKCNPRKLAS